jgi:hypothetical protein
MTLSIRLYLPSAKHGEDATPGVAAAERGAPSLLVQSVPLGDRSLLLLHELRVVRQSGIRRLRGYESGVLRVEANQVARQLPHPAGSRRREVSGQDAKETTNSHRMPPNVAGTSADRACATWIWSSGLMNRLY